MSAPEFISIHITTPDEVTAQKIGRELVKLKLVACTQIEGPITSIYNWKEKLQEDQEWRLVLKTKADHYKKIEEYILAHHPYETPQIIGLPITQSSEAYINWLSESTL